MIEKATFQPGIFSYETRKLVEMGLTIEPDQVWSYGEMGAAIDREVEGNTVSLQTALKRLSRDHGIEFKNVRGVGYLRLGDEGIAEMAPIDRRTIKRRVHRAVQRSGNIRDWEALSDRYKREVDTHRSIIGAMRQLLKPSTIKRVRSEVNRTHEELNLERTLSLFRPKAKD